MPSESIIPLELTILTSSDLHSSFYPKDNILNRSGPPICGGLGKRQTIIKKYRDQVSSTISNFTNFSCTSHSEFLLFDCGDHMTGTIFYEEYLGEVDILAIEKMNYTAISVGNHETEKGIDNLLQQYEKLTKSIPILCCNLVKKETQQLLFQRYHLINLYNYRIGIFGLLGNGAYNCMQPEFQLDHELLSPQEQYIELGNYLKFNEKCDLIICLSHSGFNEDEILTKLTSNVDILYGGHTHKTYKDSAVIIPNGNINTINGTIWHQPPSDGAAFTITNITLSKTTMDSSATLQFNSSGLEWVDVSIPDDEEIMNWFHHNYGDKLQAKLMKELAVCEISGLERDVEKMKSGKSLLGKFIAHFVAKTSETTIGLVNRGAIKIGFTPGEVITYAKAAEVLGNNNRIISIRIRGVLLYSLLKTVLPTGEFQYYGLEYQQEIISFDDSLDDGSSGERSDEPQQQILIRVNGELLRHHEWYDISLADYMWNLALHRREIYFPDIQDEIHGNIHEFYEILSSRPLYWQDDFAHHLEDLQRLSFENLLHLHDDDNTLLMPISSHPLN